MTWSRFILAVITPVVVLTFCHFGGAASANTIGLKTIKEAYDQSDVVANVVIESSRAHAANGTICGERYKGRISRIFKENFGASLTVGRQFYFGGADGLKTGREYLLFARQILSIQKEYDRVLAQLPHASHDMQNSWRHLPRQTIMALIQCDGLVPGYKFDNTVTWPIEKGDVVVFGLWPKSAIPASIQIDMQDGPEWLLRAKDVFRYLDRLDVHGSNSKN